ncbi:MAG: hypothetical protein AAF600_11030 [Bacteroidota bacterium]
MHGSGQAIPPLAVTVKPLWKRLSKAAIKGKEVGLVRADSGFYTEEIMSYLEEERLNYILAVRMYPNVKSEVWGLKEWITLTQGIELNEMRFAHEG